VGGKVKVKFASVVFVVLMAATPSAAQLPLAQPGERYEVRRIYKTETISTTGSSHSSGSDTILVRIVNVSSAGTEREYDLPRSAKAEERERQWQLPVRILAATDGSRHILNVPEMKARLADWLKRGKMTTASCGQWIFTWNAFKIECDPQAVLAMVDDFTIAPPVLREGLPYADAGALAPAALTRVANDRYAARLLVDPDAVKRDEAESAKVTAQILGPTASSMPSVRQASGTIEVEFKTDRESRPLTRTRTATIDVVLSDGTTERRRSVETLEMTAIQQSSAMAPLTR